MPKPDTIKNNKTEKIKIKNKTNKNNKNNKNNKKNTNNKNIKIKQKQ